MQKSTKTKIPESDLDLELDTTDNVPCAVGSSSTPRAENPTEDSKMFPRQAKSPVICVRTQATIRVGGEQGPAAAFRCFSTGSRARGLF